MKKLNIVYEDKNIIIINKPSHVLTISTENERENTLFHQVLTYLKKKNKNNKVFVVHRLDRDTSGLIMFAKTQEIKFALQNSWDEVERGYVAVVEGVLTGSGTLKSWLKENKALITYSSNKPNDGKLAITKYKSLTTSKNYSLIEVKILTGRKNQIRVQLSDIGHPIMGDSKYNAKTNPLNKMGLVANKIGFIHPKTHEKLTFEIDIPREFTKMFNL